MNIFNPNKTGDFYYTSHIGDQELKILIQINTIKACLYTNAGIGLIMLSLALMGLLFSKVDYNFSGIIRTGTQIITNFQPELEPNIPIIDPQSIHFPNNKQNIELSTNNTLIEPNIQEIIKTLDIPHTIEYPFPNVHLGNPNLASNETVLQKSNIQLTQYLASTNNSSSEIDYPSEEEFQVLEAEPNINLVELNKNIVYPIKMKQIGMEGKVIISALINERGEVIKTKIKYASNLYFSQAVIEALSKTYCRPGIIDKVKVKAWITIPVEFKLISK